MRAGDDDIDPFGHVNNAVYFKWSDAAAWAQWDADAASKALAKGEPRGMAVIRSEADYLRHVYKGEELDVAVWIAASDGRLRAALRAPRPAKRFFERSGKWCVLILRPVGRRACRRRSPIIIPYTPK